MARHLELEAERLEAVKPNSSAHMVESSHKAFRPKHKYPENVTKEGTIAGTAPKRVNFTKRKRGKRAGKNDKCKLLCLIACECAEPNKVLSDFISRTIYVTSHVMVALSSLVWTVYSAATEHIARD